jgi:hypothetical protein
VVLDLLPEFLGENDDILAAGIRRLLALFGVPELQVSDEAKTGSGDDDCLSLALITGKVQRRIENALESGDKARPSLGNPKVSKMVAAEANRTTRVLCQVAKEAIQIKSRRSCPKGRPKSG